MAKFLVELRYNVDRAGRADAHPAHAEYLYALADRGVLLLGGPVDGENTGLLLYEVDDRDELDAVLAGEPYVKAGLVAETRVVHWKAGKGAWATAKAETA